MNFNYQYPFMQNPAYGYMQPFPIMPPAPMPGMMDNPNMSAQDIMNESSYIENILRLNKGKVATVYMNFESSQWGSKIFRGELIQAGKDHLIIKDTQTKVNYLLLTVYLSYITFDEDIEYNLKFPN